jgi:hypothetical protein
MIYGIVERLEASFPLPPISYYALFVIKKQQRSIENQPKIYLKNANSGLLTPELAFLLSESRPV